MRKVFKVLRTVLLVIVLVLLVAGAGGYWWARSSLAQMTGNITVVGLSGPVEILRDGAAIPHIRATTSNDAYFGLGYVHAQDRLWQMEFQRRIGMSRLSEVLGPDSLDVDKFLRTLGPDRAARSAWPKINPETQAVVLAYTGGINQFIAAHQGRELPIEFTLLGFEPEPWQPEEVLVWAKMMAWNLGGNWNDELVRAEIEAKLGRAQADQLLPIYTTNGPVIVTQDVPGVDAGATRPSPAAVLPSATLAELQTVNRTIQDLLGLNSPDVGSNNWVISGDRSTTGLPLMANDPHLGAQTPSIWYLAHLTGGELDAIGATLPGVPGVVIGHNQSIAWAVTNTGPDVQDLYRERINERNEVEYQGRFEPLQVLSETIKVKGQPDVVLPIQITRHGPIVSGVIEQSEALAFRWTALDPEDSTIEAFIGINFARNWDQFTTNLRRYHTPMQNFVYADVEGNIGYYAPGALPIRRAGDGKVPVPGWTDEFEWSGYVPFEELPHTFNPPDGFIASANNKAVPDSYPHLVSTNWAAPYRAARIVELIKSKPKLSPNDMAAIQADVRSAQAQELLPLLLQARLDPADTRSQTALELLRSWDGSMQTDSAAAAVYEAWYYELAYQLFGDELGSESWENYRDSTSSIAMALPPVLNGQQSAWCDDVTTTAVSESCADTLGRALKSGLDDMAERQGSADLKQWQWGKVHHAMFPHNPLDNVTWLRPIFSRSIPNGGDGATVNVAPVRRSDGYNQYFVPSYRSVMDLSDWDNSRFIHTLGQSGHPLSPHYSDFLERWQRVEYLPMRFNPEKIDNTTVNRLTLTAGS